MLIEIEHGDDVCVLRLSGHFRSGEDLGYVRDKANEIRSHNCNKMLVDLRELKSIGSMGMGFVVGVYIYVTKRSGEACFILVAANQRVRAVLDLTRLSTIIPLAADLPSGLVVLRGEGPTARSAGTG
jgi:anti-anti-sigma factor